MLEHASIQHRLSSGEKVPSHGLLETEKIMRQSFMSADTCKSEDRELRLARRIIGTRQVKLASASPATVASIAAQIRVFIMSDLPIPIIAASGAKKDKSNRLESQEPDLAELTSLATLDSMNQAVKQIYPPGICAQIIHEDRGDIYLNGDNPNVPGFVERYMLRLDTLIDTFSCLQGVVIAARESDLLQQANITTQDNFEAEAEKYFPLFLSYLNETDRIDTEEWDHVESAKRLAEVGWIGGVPKEMRDFYYERAKLIYKTNDRELLVRNLAKMFSGVLLRKKSRVIGQIATMHPDYKDLRNATALRFSFAPPCPGMPTREGRFFLRPMPEKVCSKGIPYWAADGVMVQRNSGTRKGIYPGIRTRNDQRYANSTHIKGIMEIEEKGKTSVDASLLVDTSE